MSNGAKIFELFEKVTKENKANHSYTRIVGTH